MAPKRQVQAAPGRGGPSSNSFSAAYHELTAPENATVVRSVAIFGLAIAFFSSSLSELLIPAA